METGWWEVIAVVLDLFLDAGKGCWMTCGAVIICKESRLVTVMFRVSYFTSFIESGHDRQGTSAYVLLRCGFVYPPPRTEGSS